MSGKAICTVCGYTFAGDAAFDKHRVGKPDVRRCLSPDELRAAGWVTNAYGHWTFRTEVRPRRPRLNPAVTGSPGFAERDRLGSRYPREVSEAQKATLGGLA
jgi:hypothetical protein